MEGDTFSEERTLRLALELSMMGLGESGSLSSGMNSGLSANSPPLQTMTNSAFCSQPLLDDRQKKSQNMTECVPVPSSEHVAEIVGRQGKDFNSISLSPPPLSSYPPSSRPPDEIERLFRAFSAPAGRPLT